MIRSMRRPEHGLRERRARLPTRTSAIGVARSSREAAALGRGTRSLVRAPLRASADAEDLLSTVAAPALFDGWPLAAALSRNGSRRRQGLSPLTWEEAPTARPVHTSTHHPIPPKQANGSTGPSLD